jgi:hypothetical protein
MINVPIVQTYLPKGDDSGESWFLEDSAVVELLAADVLFVNSRKYLNLDGTTAPETLVLFVRLNDVFAWACSDAECVSLAELPALYDTWKARGDVGVEQWACLKRQMRPQYCVEQEWRRDGQWTEALEALPVRATDVFGNPKIEPRPGIKRP